MFYEETPSHVRFPHSQNGTMAKDAWWVRKVYWRRERAHNKTGKRVVFVVCTAGAFIGCVDKVKMNRYQRVRRRQKFDKTTKD